MIMVTVCFVGGVIINLPSAQNLRSISEEIN